MSDRELATQRTDLAWISLDDLLIEYLPGSYPQPWTWDDEASDIDARECACCDQPGHYQRNLEDWLRRLGHVPQGIALGGDGRIWDGHHRIVAATRLGFPGLPVENDDTGIKGQPPGDRHRPARQVAIGGAS